VSSIIETEQKKTKKNQAFREQLLSKKNRAKAELFSQKKTEENSIFYLQLRQCVQG
jgi:hypothetical protein